MDQREREIHKYDRIYERHPEYGQTEADTPRFLVARAFLEAVAGVRQVLDVGIGKGGLYNLIKDNYQVIGIEPSRVAVETYHKNDENVKQIMAQDLERHFPPDHFDVVSCLDVLEHILPEDLDNVLKALHTVGKKYFVFSIASHSDVVDGEELHVSNFPFTFWEAALCRWFRIISTIPIHQGQAQVFLLEKPGAQGAELRFSEARFHDLLRPRVKEIFREASLVSIVIPTYNQAAYLPQALESCLAQTYPFWEAIVVNDGSTDHTPEVIAAYEEKDFRIRGVHQENQGISAALNAGIREAKGEFFCWLSSDDLFYPEKLARQVKAFEALGREYALVYGSYDLLHEDCGRLEELPPQRPVPAGAEFPELLKFDFIDGCTIMVRLELLREIQGFNPHFRHAQDFELWLRLAARGYHFCLVPEKVSIRRIHPHQSSTGNLIHCRYDAYCMMNYYLSRFHFLEVFRHFDFSSPQGLELACAQLVAIMAPTEANINHPLIMPKFWAWIEDGVRALDPDLRLRFFRRLLAHLLSPPEWASRDKISFYLEKCFLALQKEPEAQEVTLPEGVEGRDLRQADRKDDPFCLELLEYGLNLLVNRHTPLFAQELTHHHTHKVVDTPYKLAHSVLRYLAQFPNPCQELVRPFAGREFIPQTGAEAVRLFCSLKFPEAAEPFHRSLELLSGEEAEVQELEEADAVLMHLPAALKARVREVCGQEPTEPLLYYWEALTWAGEGDYARALAAGWKARSPGSSPLHWWISLRLGEWAEAAGEAEKALLAYGAALQAQPRWFPAAAGFRRSRDRISQALRPRLPTPPDRLLLPADPGLPEVKLLQCDLWPQANGTYCLNLAFLLADGELKRGQVFLPYPLELNRGKIEDPGSRTVYQFSGRTIYEFWKNDYDLAEAFVRSCQAGPEGQKTGVAFTLLDSAVLGGGPQMVFRYANWLAELGVAVAIYSNDAPPPGVELKARFHRLKEEVRRYQAIEEPVVIVYSIRELPFLLKEGRAKERRFYHLCQGLEDFHCFGVTYESLMARKPIYDLLNSLPVGRIVVSPHLQEYFRKEFQQEAYLIPNGVDLRLFRPRPRRPLSDRVTILLVGNPLHYLKGVPTVKEALALVARRHPHLRIHLRQVCGENLLILHDTDTGRFGFTSTLHCQVKPEQMRELYWEADLFLNSSWYEGFGLPTLEAMACGVPVIQVDNRGLEGIAIHEENCLLVPPADPEKLAAAIERLLGDEELRGRLIAGGRKTAAGNSINRQYQAFVTVFEEILGVRFDPHLVAAEQKRLAGLEPPGLRLEAERLLTPLFSVLVPVYNQGRYLGAALDSLLAQTYGHFEVIVVNDGSTDDTPLVMERYAALDRRLRLFHKDNGGVASALNEGLRHARGEWICWLPADDLLEPEALEAHVQAIREHPRIRFFHSNFSLLEEKSGQKHRQPETYGEQLPPREFQTIAFFQGNYVHGNSVAIHRSVFEQVGFFREELRYGQDVDMWLRISARFPFQFHPRHTCITRLHPAQGTSRFPEGGIFDTARACLDFLNRHEFPALFPFLDLSRKENIFKAVEWAVNLSLNPEAHMYQGTFVPALLDRLHEWLSMECPEPHRTVLARQLGEILQAVQQGPVPAEIRENFLTLKGAGRDRFRYQPYDFLREMARYAERLELEGRRPGTLAAIRRYMEMARQDAAPKGLSGTPLQGGCPEGPPDRPGIGEMPASLPSEPDVSEAPAVAAAAPERPYVHICMVTLNRLPYTQRAIEALVRHTDHPYVLTVVDNGSRDGTPEYLKRLKEQGLIKNLVLLPENVGVARAANLAWSLEPEAPYMLKLDNDIVIQKDGWLSAMVEVIEKVPEIGVLAYNFEPCSYPLTVCRGVPLRIKNGTLGGACLLIPKRTERLLGYWNEEYAPYGEEDADYGIRVLAAGLLNAYMPDEEVGLHLPAGRAAQIDPQTFEAQDGQEEVQDGDYRRFKDRCRRRNLARFLANREAYLQGLKPLYLPNPFLEGSKSAVPEPVEALPGSGPEAPRAPGTPESREEAPPPAASIIIPVFNNLEFTRKCLAALLEHTPKELNYEIIVIDNGSTDGTGAFLEEEAAAGRVRVISNTENLGFARACNQGARAARGRYLVFLNNDTEVTPGWLEALISTAEKDEKIAAVGAKLLYPDHTVQHAGVVFNDHKKVLHIYQGFDQHHPAVNRERDFQALTGACLLVRRGPFFEVGLFDEGYLNGFEDVDLCLALRKRGYRLRYTPQAVVYHHESRTPLRRAHEGHNSLRLTGKWLAEIEPDERRYYAEDGLRLRRRKGRDGRVEIYLEDPHPNPYWEEARSHREGGNLREALKACQAALRFNPFDPRNFRILAELADLLALLEQFGPAEEVYQELARRQGTAENYYRLGVVQKRQGKYPEAIASLEQAKKLLKSPEARGCRTPGTARKAPADRIPVLQSQPGGGQ